MKILFKILMFTLFANKTFANKIDSLKTMKDVQTFMATQFKNTEYELSLMDSTMKSTDKYGKGKFFKIDFDKNMYNGHQQKRIEIKAIDIPIALANIIVQHNGNKSYCGLPHEQKPNHLE